jgi:thiosulfate dehydrogenase [quinone] large subunit
MTSAGEPSMSTNPFMDYHILYALVLVLLAVANAGAMWGFGKAWERLPVVRRLPWLR